MPLIKQQASGTGHAPLGGFSDSSHLSFTSVVPHPDAIGKVLSLCPTPTPLNVGVPYGDDLDSHVLSLRTLSQYRLLLP